MRGMDAEPEAYRDVFTASAALPTSRRRRINATKPNNNPNEIPQLRLVSRRMTVGGGADFLEHVTDV